MIFKSICTLYHQAQALKNYRAERERFEREQQEHNELMLFVRLVNESRRNSSSRG